MLYLLRWASWIQAEKGSVACWYAEMSEIASLEFVLLLISFWQQNADRCSLLTKVCIEPYTLQSY